MTLQKKCMNLVGLLNQLKQIQCAKDARRMSMKSTLAMMKNADAMNVILNLK